MPVRRGLGRQHVVVVDERAPIVTALDPDVDREQVVMSPRLRGLAGAGDQRQAAVGPDPRRPAGLLRAGLQRCEHAAPRMHLAGGVDEGEVASEQLFGGGLVAAADRIRELACRGQHRLPVGRPARLHCCCRAEPSWRKYTSTFMPAASGPGSARSTTTSTTLTSVRLRCPRSRPASTSGAIDKTLPLISRPRNAVVRTIAFWPTRMSPKSRSSTSARTRSLETSPSTSSGCGDEGLASSPRWALTWRTVAAS